MRGSFPAINAVPSSVHRSGAELEIASTTSVARCTPAVQSHGLFGVDLSRRDAQRRARVQSVRRVWCTTQRQRDTLRRVRTKEESPGASVLTTRTISIEGGVR